MMASASRSSGLDIPFVEMPPHHARRRPVIRPILT